MYASLIGDVDGIRLFDDATLKTATEEQRNGPDRILFNSSRFALGYWLDCALFRMIGPSSFGHPGAGGSMGFADPELELAFGYVPNRSAIGLTGDPRSERLMAACREVIGA